MSEPEFKDYIKLTQINNSLQKQLKRAEEHIQKLESELLRAHDQMMRQGISPA